MGIDRTPGTKTRRRITIALSMACTLALALLTGRIWYCHHALETISGRVVQSFFAESRRGPLLVLVDHVSYGSATLHVAGTRLVALALATGARVAVRVDEDLDLCAPAAIDRVWCRKGSHAMLLSLPDFSQVADVGNLLARLPSDRPDAGDCAAEGFRFDADIGVVHTAGAHWNVPLASTCESARIVDHALIVATGDAMERAIALDVDTGARRWRYTFEKPVRDKRSQNAER